MESTKIVSELAKAGHKVETGVYEYWDRVPYVLHADGSKTFIAKTYTAAGSAGIERNVSFEKAQKAVEMKCADINDLESRLESQRIQEEAEALAKKFS